jgi:hypothetical protein
MIKKYPSELNTRTVRISSGDYAMLVEIGRRANISIADALHLVLKNQTLDEHSISARIPPAQIPMISP